MLDRLRYELLRHAIVSHRDFTCPLCRDILDVTRACLVSAEDTERSTISSEIVLCCGCYDAIDRAPDAWEPGIDALRRAGASTVRLSVIDGRDYTRAGTLRAAGPSHPDRIFTEV